MKTITKYACYGYCRNGKKPPISEILLKISKTIQRSIFSISSVYRIAWGLVLVLAVAIPVSGESFKISEEVANTFRKLLAEPTMNSQVAERCSQHVADLELFRAKLKCEKKQKKPPPPKLPRNFRWEGRYIVPDLVDPTTGKLGINVPFTWQGKDGNIQMIAGGEEYPIYFTNIIYQNHLYTYTFKWPGLQDPFLPPLEPCKPLLKFTLEDLNAILANASFVGPVILKNPCRQVNHFRVAIVTPPPQPPGFYLRLPLILGDFYVDRNDSSKFWQVLHFGIQNLYDPNMDEWIVIT